MLYPQSDRATSTNCLKLLKGFWTKNPFPSGKFQDTCSFPEGKAVATIEKISRSTRPLEIFLHHSARAVIQRLQPRIGLNDVNHFDLLALPFLGFNIEGGVNEALPVFVITGREI